MSRLILHLLAPFKSFFKTPIVFKFHKTNLISSSFGNRISLQVGLTHQQAMALFEAIGSLENVRLRKLNLSHNNLADVPSQILAKAVIRLNEVQLVG